MLWGTVREFWNAGLRRGNVTMLAGTCCCKLYALLGTASIAEKSHCRTAYSFARTTICASSLNCSKFCSQSIRSQSVWLHPLIHGALNRHHIALCMACRLKVPHASMHSNIALRAQRPPASPAARAPRVTCSRSLCPWSFHCVQ